MATALSAYSTESILKNYAVSVLASLSEKKMSEFLRLFADENTLARMESELLAYGKNAGTYNNFEEFMADMEKEDEV